MYKRQVQGSQKNVYISYSIESWVGEQDLEMHGVAVIDLLGNILYEEDEATEYSDYSNIAVADFNKDGNNEMCYFNCNSDTNFIDFTCYDEDFNEIFYKNNMSEDFGYTGSNEKVCPDFVMGDFMTEYDRLCLATVEGIFCFNGTNDTIHIYDTSYTSGIGTPLVVEVTNEGYLGVVYSDSSKSFVITPDFINYSTCGNGFCELWENSFICPEDCYYTESDIDAEGEYREGSPCETDSDCADGLKCEYGICSKLGYNDDCTNDNDCISDSCINGKCTKPSLWQGIDASKDQLAGDDTFTNNFIALVLILGISGVLGYYGNIWAGIASLYVLGIFFTIVGWLSIIILFGFILTGVIAIVFKFMVKQGE